MHRVARGGRAFVRAAPMFLILAVAGATGVATARTVRVHAFNIPANTAYDARHNGVTRATIASSEAGAITRSFDAAPGDLLAFVTADLAPPPPPVFTTVAPDGAGCAHAAWQPSGDPTVVGYVVYAGSRSVAGGQAGSYDVSLDAGAASSASICSLPPGVNYVAVRSRNYAGVLSAYSVERTVTITTLAVLISSFRARLADAGVRLSWDVEADEVVLGYRIYRSEGEAGEVPLVEELLPVNTDEFVDADTRGGASYTYVLGVTREDGSEIRSVPVTVATPAVALALGQNAPNPFNPATRIPFTLARAARVVLRVYDVRGALVTTLFEGQLGEGAHTMAWDGRDAAGRPVSSGIYVYALTADRRTLSKKMTLLK